MKKIFFTIVLVLCGAYAQAQNYLIIDGVAYQLTPATSGTTISPSSTYSLPPSTNQPSNYYQMPGFQLPQQVNNSYSSAYPNTTYSDNSRNLYDMQMRLSNVRQGVQLVNDFVNLIGNTYNVGGGMYNNASQNFVPVQFSGW